MFCDADLMNKTLIIFFAFICLTFNSFASQLVIALDADFSGGAKNGGIAIQRGVELAIDDVNQKGGVLGKQLTLVTSNHRGNPARGVANVKKHLEDERVIAIVGGVHTPVVMAQLPTVNQSGLPFLIPWAAGTKIVENGLETNNVFRVSLRDSDAAVTILDFARQNGYKNVSLVLERTGWGRSNETSMKRYANQVGIIVDEVVWFNWRQKSFTSLLEQIQVKQDKALILVANAPEGADFLLALQDTPKKSSLPVLSHWGIAAGDFVSMVGLEKLNNMSLAVLQSFHFSNTKMQENAQNLLSKYSEKYEVEADETNIKAAVGLAQGYDIVQLLAKSIKQARSVEASAIITELEKIENYEGIVKYYKQPFSASKRDALLADDYLMTRFNKQGYLVPASND
jgi:branched-chain amino acid transport system substrate-binding protein